MTCPRKQQQNVIGGRTKKPGINDSEYQYGARFNKHKYGSKFDNAEAHGHN